VGGFDLSFIVLFFAIEILQRALCPAGAGFGIF
jgi:uncharacterized protein YggT (Ycf19 family)